MAIQKKHGKGRLDKWYKLAKEKGYRARAAFKLIQLNKKYGFLEKSKVLLDLCAAPGSWSQVAAETMPNNSLIIGVDLAPIKAIPRVISFQGDITTDKCRGTIRQHLKSWKVDTVLHDGAPNVGTAWVQDAFSQAELVLQSLRLATDFLGEGGTFVTKIFRSKDYNSLLWVFNQLFSKVESTKPPSSRNVSAEIFVVCRGYKAPKKVDPKFLDPRSVFAELSDPAPNNEAKVFNPEKKKRKRDGYEEGNLTQYKETPASAFIQTTNPIDMLGSFNKLSFEQTKNGDVALAALDRTPETTDEIRACCMDLKVLGRKEFRILLKWRLKIRDKFGFASKKRDSSQQPQDEEVAEVTPLDEELQIQEELQHLNENDTARKKRERRRENERKQKEITRMQLHMTAPTEIGIEQAGLNGEGSMFALKPLDRAGVTNRVARGRMIADPSKNDDRERVDEVAGSESDPEEDQLETQLDSMYEQYQTRKSDSDAKYRAKKARKEGPDGDFEGFSDKQSSDESDFEEEKSSGDESDEEMLDGTEKGLIRGDDSHDITHSGLTARAARFFDQDLFQDIGAFSGAQEGGEIEEEEDVTSMESQSIDGEVDEMESSATSPEHDSGQDGSYSEDLRNDFDDGAKSELARSGGAEAADEAEEDTFEVFKSANRSDWDEEDEPKKNGKLDVDIITAEAMTLAHKLATGQATKYDLMDENFNKINLRDRDGLPEWFLDDEDKHSRQNRPISAAAAAAIKEKLRALNARPIKKVREAKDRKKFKASQKLEKLRKKSAVLAEEEGTSEKDKAQNIAKLMSKAAKKKPKQKIQLVVAKGGNRGVSGRPRGVKGKYKIVDSRLKKDTRAQKRLAKKRK